jgi:hypothetical protein
MYAQVFFRIYLVPTRTYTRCQIHWVRNQQGVAVISRLNQKVATTAILCMSRLS